MWNQKLCLGLSSQFGIDEVSQIELFARVGLTRSFRVGRVGAILARFRAAGDRCGMEFQSIHAPFGRMDRMWKEAPDTEDTVAELCECLRDCAEYHVPVMVAHAFIGFEEHSPNEIGVRNFGRVVDEAERLGVKLALENTEGIEYLSRLFEAFSDRECVGFCWDTGHEMCYNWSEDVVGGSDRTGSCSLRI